MNSSANHVWAEKRRCLAWVLLSLLALLFHAGITSASAAAKTVKVTPALGSAPAYYQKQATWQETFLASWAAIENANLKDEFPPFESETLWGGQPGRKISIPIQGAKQVYLLVTACPDKRWPVGDWAEARLLTAAGKSTSVSVSKNYKVFRGRCEEDLTLRSGLYQKMRLGEVTFERGLNVQANSVILLPLDGEFERFEATVGVDAWAGTNGSLRFSVVGAKTAARKRLYEYVTLDFPEGVAGQQMDWEREDRIFEFEWSGTDWTQLALRYAQASHRVPALAAQSQAAASQVKDAAGLARVRENYYHSRELAAAVEELRNFDYEALRLALEDLHNSFPQQYSPARLEQFHKLTRTAQQAQEKFKVARLADFTAAETALHALEAFKREVLLANPLLDFERLLIVKRKPIGTARRFEWDGYGYGELLGLPRQSSWNNGTMPNVDRWTNEIAVLSPVRPEGRLTTFFQPDRTALINYVDLHWNADKLLFSMPDTNRNWQVFELRADGSGLRQLTPSIHPDVHNYNGIYLPNGKINFLSTAPLQGVPCNAGVIVGMMYQMEGDGRNIHQLCFEQDHDYTPSVLNNGRVMYLRWDYTDTPHVWNRLLMSMNPDGTGQMEYYGANSYWPNAIFFARAIPKHQTRIVSIVTGHHEGRVGDLVIFDPALGRQETNGVVQRIPGRGKPVEPKIEDKLTEHNWPKFLHPWPLSDKYFLVSAKPTPDSLWGIYLVDVFDNMVLVKEEEGVALMEPVPFQPRTLPPVIQDKTNPEQKDALVYMEDVYSGPGLKDVPRGTVKNLRLFAYHFGYQKLAGIDHRVGADGPWEAKRVLGTVPVEADGSALFRVPAKTPISIQPLDAEGKAVALMRSWMTAMPGENVSCVGCHDRQNGAPPAMQRRIALTRDPSEIQPWHGPVRGFSFQREVQPVLDKYCVGCHNGETRVVGKAIPDLRRDQGGYVVYKGNTLDGQFMRGKSREDLLGKYGAVFDPSYVVLRQYVRVGGLESDLHLLPPREFHADTSELIRMLQKGHHQVQLDTEAWDRFFTWIDLNAPCHGTWAETTKIPGPLCDRRLELRKAYGGVVENDEEIVAAPYTAPVPVMPPAPTVKNTPPITAPDWPLPPAEARARQSAGGQTKRIVDLGDGIKMEFVQIPAGTFVMGDANGERDEQPQSVVRIAKPFWMASFEVSNEQFRRFDARHDSRFEHRSSWIFSEEYLGWPLNQPRQPVVRVSWHEAMAFCDWLSAKLGEPANLPTEAQWEYACRAGSSSPMNYGGLDEDFSKLANMGDASLRRLAEEGWRPRSPDLIPRDDRFNDGLLVTAETGHYQPNPWGLFDMHGNAAEWTRSTYRPYPYPAEDGRDDWQAAGKKVARGGSWRDRPKYCHSAYRYAYPPEQKVFNVGFRVIIEAGKGPLKAETAPTKHARNRE